jgi:nucleotide-binding universal stress UspA family protein
MNETVNVNQEQASQTPRTRKVVVGVDGSQSSVAALREGARLAAERGDDLVAIAAWHMPISYGGFPAGWYPEADAESTLDATAKATFGDDLPAGYSQLVLQGLPAHVLIEESRDADLLVVGSRGHGGFAGLLLGSVSQACAEYAKCPVLIIHGDVGAFPKARADSSLAATH